MQPPGSPKQPTAKPRSMVLIGASVRSATESARRAGFAPIAVDAFGDRETLRSAVSWSAIDSFGETELVRSLEAGAIGDVRLAIVGGLDGGYQRWAGLRCPFHGAGPSVFDQCDGPEFLRELARQAKVCFPETINDEPPRNEAGWLVKRRFSCGGLHVRTRGETPRALNEYFQRFQRGRVVGASFLATGEDAILLGVCGLFRKRLGRRPFVFAGAVGPLRFPDSVIRRIQAIGDAFVARFPFVGPFNIDLVIRRDQVMLLEVNPRWSGSMELLERSWSTKLDEALFVL